jgi:hypothetical protein
MPAPSIALVISAWPILSQASEFSDVTAAFMYGAIALIVARGLARLGVEIFDRLEVEQRIDRVRHRAGVEVVHLLAQLRAPVGHPAGEGDIDDHHRQRAGDQPTPNASRRCRAPATSSRIVGAMLNSRK